MNELYTTAKFWLSQGIATIPIQYMRKDPRIKWLPYTEHLPTHNDIAYWFASRLSNIGIITGWNNLTILDFDNMGKFIKWVRWAKETGNKKAQRIIDETRIVFSKRGVHLYIYCPDAENMKLDKIDILANRKYALIPPSIHPDGKKPYELFRDVLPITISNYTDIFPVEWLDQAEKEQKNDINSNFSEERQAEIIDYDPWKIAGIGEMQPVSVKSIKENLRIEDLFTELYPNNFLSNSDNTGRYKITCCPFHDDHNPSFWIDIEKQICGCHSGCTQKPLDIINLYAKAKAISDREAIKALSSYIR